MGQEKEENKVKNVFVSKNATSGDRFGIQGNPNPQSVKTVIIFYYFIITPK
jgi:hypothetical protein